MSGVHVIFLGAPGAGKGTQAKRIAEHYQAAHISTGDILREAKRNETELGLKAKAYMDSGNLVPDALIIEMIREKMSEPGFPSNWLMDGFPRTLPQAEAFDQLLKSLDLELTSVLNMDVPMGLLMDRLTQRRTCRKTGEIFNLKFNPPEHPEHYELYQREDDQEEAVKNRLNVYLRDTEPLIEYYRQQGKLVDIAGDQAVEKVTEAIFSAIKQNSL